MSDKEALQAAATENESLDPDTSHTEGIEKAPPAETGTETKGPAGE